MEEKLSNKIVLITGASEGIGKACAIEFAKYGAKLILLARTLSKLEELSKDLHEKYNTEIFFQSVDIRDNKKINEFYKTIPENFNDIDILINNAGMARGLNKLYEDVPEDWDEMIDTNIKGVLYISKVVIPEMVKKKSGHIINLGSIAGHEAYPKGGVYCATKHALASITKSLRQDVIDKNIKVTSIDPGMVETNFSNVRFYGDMLKAKNVYTGLTPLKAKDIAETIIFCATRPAHVNINELIIMPSAQANSYVNYRV